jgi:RsiW-degrading membrane proteinase PrsW (M82 family)
MLTDILSILFHSVLALSPVALFLAGLIFLDSYKLIHLRTVIQTILVGCAAAGAAMVLNSQVAETLGLSWVVLSRYVSPLLEETLKAMFLLYLLKANKVGFLADAAIRGFAIGAGFAMIENLYYIWQRPDADLYLWIIRGFGTAIMHGGATAVVGILAQGIAERAGSLTILAFLPALAAGAALHSLYNHFFLNPLVSTLIILVLFPGVVILAFRESEDATRKWLGVGFDSDRELLEMMTTGVLSETRIGRYLDSLEHKFPGEMIADMLCYLRLHLELSVEAKGMLLMREAGFDVPANKEVEEKFTELLYLEKSIGKTGKLALHPFLHTRTKDLWQITMLKSSG